MLKIIFITVLTYSFILTCACVYKDCSSYFSCDEIDVVVAGPCMWLLVLLLLACKPVINHLRKKRTKKTYTPKSSKYIAKTVSRIMSVYTKHWKNNDIFDLSRMLSTEYGDVNGWEDLEIRNPRYEHLNRKFTRLMLYQEEETVEALKPYFDIVPESEVADKWNLNTKTTYYRVRKGK